MLIGEYSYAIDDKGRLNFPPKFREAMGGTFIVTRWLDDCLVAFPEDEWERISALLSEKSMVKSRDVQRFLYATAVEASPDKQGRILLPPTCASMRSWKRTLRSSAWAAMPRYGTRRPGSR